MKPLYDRLYPREHREYVHRYNHAVNELNLNKDPRRQMKLEMRYKAAKRRLEKVVGHTVSES